MSPLPVAVEMPLQLLHSLPAQGVYSLQPLQGGGEPPGERREPKDRNLPQEGSAAARLFATIRDARFDAGGQLLCLLVAPAVVDARGGDVVRELPAAAVRWDDGRRQWFVIEPNLQFAGLTASSPAPPGERPSKAPPATSLLASWLLQATFDLQPATAPATLPVPLPVPLPAGPTPKARTTSPDPTTSSPPATVVWMAGSAQRLVVVLLPIVGPQVDGERAVKHVAVPWSLVRVANAGSTARLRVTAAAATVHSAPEGAPTEAPTRALRHRCYLHYGIAPPDWEAAISAPRGAGK